MAVVRTVLGDIPAEQVGITFTHEHITWASASAKRDLGSLYNLEAIVRRVADSVGVAKHNFHVATLVCASNAEMGRDVDICAEVSRRTGVNIVASTGAYRQTGGVSLYWDHQTGEEFEEYLTREVTVGVGRNKIRCGHMKMGWSGYTPTRTEEKLCRAAAHVAARLNIPVSFHCTYSDDPQEAHGQRGRGPLSPGANPGAAMVDLMTAEGMRPSKVKIDHAQAARGKLWLLIEVLRKGAYISFEFNATGDASTSMSIASIGALISAGYVKQITLSPQAIGPGWIPVQPPKQAAEWSQDHSYLHRVVVPKMLQVGIEREDINQMLVENPKGFLAF
ncbi:MAG: hypothetical protein HYY31_04890 [Chloroflexi bacterium]|nr:hypothetical protein [Chloroflexota bacterium]